MHAQHVSEVWRCRVAERTRMIDYLSQRSQCVCGGGGAKAVVANEEEPNSRRRSTPWNNVMNVAVAF
jgi:hypothetical protein